MARRLSSPCSLCTRTACSRSTWTNPAPRCGSSTARRPSSPRPSCAARRATTPRRWHTSPERCSTASTAAARRCSRPGSSRAEPERGGVELDGGAVRVDARLQATVPGVWAAGDVTGGLQFTHVAEYMRRSWSKTPSPRSRLKWTTASSPG
ncbi:MAG: FAD-dependent oxidoreductase [Gemmatimonadales bacterium]